MDSDAGCAQCYRQVQGEIMTTFTNVSENEFRGAAAEFFRATQDRSAIRPDQAENGHKALTLMYFGGHESWSEVQIHSAALILELAAKRVFEVELANIGMKS